VDQIRLDGDPLTIDAVVAVARDDASFVVDGPRIEARMGPARDLVASLVASGDVAYGVNTGFGALANVRIEPEQVKTLQRSIVRSHAAGVGDPLPREVVRAMMLLRARTLAAGYAGARPALVHAIAALLNAGITPVVPQHGSVGASGDLAPLAHAALVLLGEGEAWLPDGARVDGASALRAAGLEPIVLEAKEGLALVNGTDGMLAMGCLAVTDLERLAASADVVCALSVQALLATDRAFAPELHALRPQAGQAASAATIRAICKDAPIMASHRALPHAVQDAYSLRCTPQVHGAVRATIDHARRVVEAELVSVVDNPVVLAEQGRIESAGNFHGEPLAFILDFCAIAACELASISERRTDRMLDPAHSHGLPAFLVEDPGVNSGFMLAQYTQASLVSQLRRLAVPASTDSIPTSGTTEDHNSMGFDAGLKLRRAIERATSVLGIEAVAAVQALELRSRVGHEDALDLEPSPVAAAVCRRIRAEVAFLDVDRVLGPDLEAGGRLVSSGELLRTALELL
jgi:histidine ammonia-lyase